MAGGIYNLTELPIRPGIYMNFIAAAVAEIQGGPRGIVGLPIMADWGPVGTFEVITQERELKNTFYSGRGVDLALRCLKAGKNFRPTKIVLRRMAGSGAAKASLELDSLTITARYPGIRGNDLNITVAPNIVEPEVKDLKVFAGETLITSYVLNLTDRTSVEKSLEGINSDEERMIDVTLKADNPIAVNNAANQALTGGNSGEDLTAYDYLSAMESYESEFINVFVLPGVTDAAIQASAMAWIKRLRDGGRKIQYVMGGTCDEDKDIKKGNQRSRNADHEGIINVVVGTVVRGTRYNSAETACQVAGLVAGVPINKSVTYKALDDVDELTVHLTDDEIKTGIRGGSFMLIADLDIITGAVTYKVETGINTLTTYGAEKNERFSKIRVIRTLDAISDDITRTANQQYIGELNNDDDGRTALICAIKRYLETLAAAHAISQDFSSEVSKYIQSEGDKVFLNTDIIPIDSIERIFNEIKVH